VAEFQVSHQDRLGVLSLQVNGAHGAEKLEIAFPSNDEAAVSKAMEQMLRPRAQRQAAGEAPVRDTAS
jgi:hypothetical protein